LKAKEKMRHGAANLAGFEGGTRFALDYILVMEVFFW
jgi:hypothetical protein